MNLFAKIVLFSFFSLLALPCSSKPFGEFKQETTTEADEADTEAERALILNDWANEIARLNDAYSWDDDTRKDNLMVEERGVALTDNQIQDRIEFLEEQRAYYAGLWNIQI